MPRQRVDPRRRGHAPLTVVPGRETRAAAPPEAPPPRRRRRAAPRTRPPPKPVSRVSARPTYTSSARLHVVRPGLLARQQARVRDADEGRPRQCPSPRARRWDDRFCFWCCAPDGEAARAGDCERLPPSPQARARPRRRLRSAPRAPSSLVEDIDYRAGAARYVRIFDCRDQHRPSGEARAGLPRRHDAPAAGSVAREAPPRARVAPRRHDEHLRSREAHARLLPEKVSSAPCSPRRRGPRARRCSTAARLPGSGAKPRSRGSTRATSPVPPHLWLLARRLLACSTACAAFGLFA